MKKSIALLTASALCAASLFAGCGKEAPAADTKESAETTESAEAADTAEETAAPAEVVIENEHVSVGPYKGIEYNAVKTTVTDEMLEEEMNYLLEMYAEAGEADHDVVEEGDTIVFDFSGIHNGERFEGGTSEDYTLTDVGSGQMIPGFEENLIGHKVGESYSFEVTFPDPYQNNEELSGEEVTFEITIDKILGEDIVPELNDDFAANVQTYFEVNTAEELRAALRKELEGFYEQQDLTNNQQAVWDAVSSTFTLKTADEEVLKSFEDEFYDYYEEAAEGSEFETFAEYIEASYGMTEDEFAERAKSYANEVYLEDEAIKLIAETEGLEIDNESLEAGYARFQEEYDMDKDTVLQYFGSEANFQRQLRYETVTQWVYENAVPVYGEADAAASSEVTSEAAEE